MKHFELFSILFEDETVHISPLPERGELMTVDNTNKPNAPMEIAFYPDSTYPYTVSFEGVSSYFTTEEEGFDYACRIYGGEWCVLNFFSHGVSRLRYAISFEALDLESSVMGFAVSAAAGRRALSGLIASLVKEGACHCRLRTYDGGSDQSIVLSL